MEANSSISCSQGYYTTKPSQEKKLRLFGIELDSSHQTREPDLHKGPQEGGDESVNSSASSTVTEKPGLKKSLARGSESEEDKNFECQYCSKVFANSQALGGHQNAHKKERMRKKRLQLQARKASYNCYIQPLQNYHNNNFYKHSFSYHYGPDLTWFYDPSYHLPESMYEGSQISFCPNPDIVRPEITRGNVDLVDDVPFQRDTLSFSLTHADRSREKLRALNSSSKKICSRKTLDIQLGLGLH